MNNQYFMSFVNKFKQDLKDGKHECLIKYELYGPNITLQYSNHMYKEPVNYFLFYITDKGYTYTMYETKNEICDAMEGWCTQCFQHITIKLK